jgi:hypothetical protein
LLPTVLLGLTKPSLPLQPKTMAILATFTAKYLKYSRSFKPSKLGLKIISTPQKINYNQTVPEC